MWRPGVGRFVGARGFLSVGSAEEEGTQEVGL